MRDRDPFTVKMMMNNLRDHYDMDYRILDESIFVTGIGAAFAINDDRGIEEKLSEKFDEMQKDGTMEIIVSKYLSNAYKYLEVDSLE